MKIADREFHPYTRADELWVVTVYYNPCDYQSRRDTYDIFIQTMRLSEINVLTVECAFGNDPFELPLSHDVIRLRSNSVLWQKERLINIGASFLPRSCKCVAWVDCDILFENPNWTRETCELLSSSCTVLQPWKTCLRLEQGNRFPDGHHADQVVSFAAVTTEDMSTLDYGQYDRHGHTGYAWAMRREIFDAVGLYEYAVAGSADHYISHAVYGHHGICIQKALRYDPMQSSHLKRWADEFYFHVQGRCGVVPGEICHLWHGTRERRNYSKRQDEITNHGYNPDTDILVEKGQPLEWHPNVHANKPGLVAYLKEYFALRQEDCA